MLVPFISKASDLTQVLLKLNRIKSASSPAFETDYSYDVDGNLQQLNQDGGSINYTYGKAN